MLTKVEILEELYNRTGLPQDTLWTVISTYADIIKECILNQVEVPLLGLGTFSFKEWKPTDKVMQFEDSKFGIRKGETYHVKGYLAPWFKPSDPWKKELKAKTEWDYGEE